MSDNQKVVPSENEQKNAGTIEEKIKDIMLSLPGDSDSATEAENSLRQYFIQSGLCVEPGISNEKKALDLAKRRQENYLNIRSLLINYRSFRKIYEFLKENFIESLKEDSLEYSPPDYDTSDKFMFDKICKQLDIMSVAEERRFQRTYAPQAIICRKFEVALDAIDFGLKILQREDEDAYKIIYCSFVEGKKKKKIMDIVSQLENVSTSTYYKRLNAAEKKLANYVFGYYSKEDKLHDIIAYILQKQANPEFPYSQNDLD